MELLGVDKRIDRLEVNDFFRSRSGGLINDFRRKLNCERYPM
jgi:hypothetical protein